TAGRGIVHSERAPKSFLQTGGPLSGIQLWVALPTEHEECAPSFVHHRKQNLPEFIEQGTPVKLILGSAFGQSSPVGVLSPMFYLEVHLQKGARFVLPLNGQEGAVYVVAG